MALGICSFSCALESAIFKRSPQRPCRLSESDKTLQHVLKKSIKTFGAITCRHLHDLQTLCSTNPIKQTLKATVALYRGEIALSGVPLYSFEWGRLSGASLVQIDEKSHRANTRCQPIPWKITRVLTRLTLNPESRSLNPKTLTPNPKP